MAFPFYRQLNEMDCGPTCLRMIAKHYGKHYNADKLRQKAGYSKDGVSLLGISETAGSIGFRTRGVQVSFDSLLQAPLPAILHWNQNHFVVLVSVTRRRAVIADPARGIVTQPNAEFLHHWISNKKQGTEPAGTVLLLQPSPAFYASETDKEQKLSWGVITRYFNQSKWPLIQVFISLIIGSILQIILPFLTQSMVDTGINTRNMQYITIVLSAQLMLTLSSTVIDFIRNRLQLRMSNSVNISILSDFWIKITRLPLSYFDSHHTGDIMQRLGDNKQVQSFLTGSALTTLFSIFNFTAYAVILASYSIELFFVFALGNLLYFGYIRLFLRIRRKINYETFHISAKENSATLQLIQGMNEIRLNNAEQLKRWEWENIQARIFRLNFKSLNYSQWQSAGALFITQGKDIIITFIVAGLVVEGRLTFGTMLAIQYIIGQLNGPVQQFIGFIQNLQDAKISLERLNEIHQMEDEEPSETKLQSYLPRDKSIHFKQLSFTYPGAGNDAVLKDISLDIPEGKITAIVGTSGSGKTTLLKLLLKIYDQYEGELKIGDSNFRYISPSFWRRQCGAVLQDGYIFNDTIAGNIAVGDEYVNYEKLVECCRMANILPFVETLPNGFNTVMGAEGINVSQGQRQRLLIARVIYKEPQYLFFDEATNALDANNEKAIVENLGRFFKGKTVVIVAHRLSTVRDADNIVVLDDGKIAEEGSHAYLTSTRGKYFQLVKNQLELGS